jgi:hypothetical protein
MLFKSRLFLSCLFVNLQFTIDNLKFRHRRQPDPDSLKSRFKRLFTFDQADCAHLPLVCLGRLDSETVILNPDVSG